MTYFLSCPSTALEDLTKFSVVSSDINKQLLDLHALCGLFSGMAFALISFYAEVA